MFTKKQILAEIRRTAEENAGQPLGWRKFSAETGASMADIRKFWARYGDAVREIGLTPNQLTQAFSDDYLLGKLALLAQELGRFPYTSEINLKARQNKDFPWVKTYTTKFGRQAQLAQRLQAHCDENLIHDVSKMCADFLSSKTQSPTDVDEAAQEEQIGYIYLLKMGRHHKIGRSKATGRRESELAIQLPERAKLIHEIATDDPVGIEAYWHGRFADKRKNGEWFELTAKDIAAFKRRKFM